MDWGDGKQGHCGKERFSTEGVRSWGQGTLEIGGSTVALVGFDGPNTEIFCVTIVAKVH